MLAFEPIGKFSDAFFDLCLRIVAEQFARFGNIGECLRNVARLQRFAVDERFFTEILLD